MPKRGICFTIPSLNFCLPDFLYMNEHVSVPSPVGEDYLLLGQYAERAYLE